MPIQTYGLSISLFNEPAAEPVNIRMAININLEGRYDAKDLRGVLIGLAPQRIKASWKQREVRPEESVIHISQLIPSSTLFDSVVAFDSEMKMACRVGKGLQKLNRKIGATLRPVDSFTFVGPVTFNCEDQTVAAAIVVERGAA